MKDTPSAGPDLIVKPQELAHLANHVESRLPAAYGPRLLHLSEGSFPALTCSSRRGR